MSLGASDLCIRRLDRYFERIGDRLGRCTSGDFTSSPSSARTFMRGWDGFSVYPAPWLSGVLVFLPARSSGVVTG